MISVVIVGAGFGGIACARSLLQSNIQCKITVIDRNPYHTIHGNIYEVASSPSELSDLRELKTTVEIPLAEIFRDKRVTVVVGSATAIDAKRRTVSVNHQNISYDYLVMAQGAVPNFFGISGASDYALPMQAARDALRIRNAVEQVITAERFKATKPIINIVVAGGGVAGIEIAAELQGFIKFIAWQNSVPLDKIRTIIAERAPVLLPGFDPRASKAAEDRLQALGVYISCNSALKAVTPAEIILEDGLALRYEVLVWTAGVMGAPMIPGLEAEIGKGNRVMVDKCFRTTANGVFVLGDQCCFIDDGGVPLPGTAAQAMYQGRYIASAISQLARNITPQPHRCKKFPMLMPLGGTCGMYYSSNLLLTGYVPYLMRRWVWLHYFISLLGLRRGLHWAFRSDMLYSRNN